MKILHYISSHRVIVASILLVVVLGASSALAFAFLNKPEVASVSNISETKKEVKKPVEEKVTDAVTETPLAQTVTPEQQKQEVPAPATRTIDDITIAEIEAKSFEGRCPSMNMRATAVSIPADQWEDWIKNKITTKEPGIFINPITETKVCVYWGTLEDLL